MTAYIVFRIVLALLLGAVIYSIDRRFGVRPYRWWYGMTHETGLPPDVRKGFVYNRDTRARALTATILSIIVAVIAVKYATSNSLAELILWLLTIPLLVAGFMLGPIIYKLWQRRDDVFDVVDKFEGGKIDISDEVKARSASLWSKVAGKGEEKEIIEEKPAEPVSSPTASPQVPPAPDVPAAAQPSPEEMMEKYIRNRTGGS